MTKRLTGPQELAATFITCGLAVAAVTAIVSEREPTDWLTAAGCAIAVTAGTAVRQLFGRRRRHIRSA